VTPAGLRADVVHVHFHDTDLVDGRRSTALRWALSLLGRRRTASDLDRIVRQLADTAPEVAFAQVAAG
jgi:hypothetical protein